jgi:WhiB family redox-sensing transcriptional regulator
MTTRKNTTGTGGSRGNYDYMQLLSEFALVVHDFDWMGDAACRGSGIDFFPEETYNVDAPKAMAVCRTCPVREKCLDFAVKNNMKYGIWGGLNPVQRRRYLRHGFQTGTVEP